MSSKKITFYGYDKCSTCRKAKQFLKTRNAELDEKDITITPPSKTLLSQLLSKGYKLSDLFNKSGDMYRSLNMKEKIKTLSENEALELLSKNGKLIKRPIAYSGKEMSVGFDEEKLTNLIK